jgi:hypothetical protein
MLVAKKDFAAILGCSKAYVSQLIAAKRIVLSEDGRQVDVEPSLELLGATADPSKAGVRERWAAYREQHAATAAPAASLTDTAARPASPPPAASAATGAPDPAAAATEPAPPQAAAHQAAPAAPSAPSQPSLLDDSAPAPASTAAAQAPAPAPARSEYQDARALREKAQAAMAQIELRRLQGQVVDAEPVLRAVADIHIAARNELMALADRVTPLVAAETDPRRVWDLINVEAERLAERMQRAAQQLAERRRVEVPA